MSQLTLIYYIKDPDGVEHAARSDEEYSRLFAELVSKFGVESEFIVRAEFEK